MGVPPSSQSQQNSQSSQKTETAAASAASNAAHGAGPYQTPSTDSIFGPAANPTRAAAGGNVTIAGSAEAKAANDAYGSSADVSWGSFASDRKKKEDKK
jgi:hypothetical protein